MKLVHLVIPFAAALAAGLAVAAHAQEPLLLLNDVTPIMAPPADTTSPSRSPLPRHTTRPAIDTALLLLPTRQAIAEPEAQTSPAAPVVATLEPAKPERDVVAAPPPALRAEPPKVTQIPAAPALPSATDVPTVRSIAPIESPIPGRIVPRSPVAARGDARPSEMAAQTLSLEINKSRIVRLSRPARDVLVANPAVADVVMRSADMAFIIGRKVGETNVFFFDGDGRQIDSLDVDVTFDSAAVMTALKRMIPNERVEVTTANQSLVLAGTVASAQVAENVRQIARQFVADDSAIINLLNIRDKNQVLLRVRVSEMGRQVVKELGITPGSPPFNFSVGGSRFNLSGTQSSFNSAPFAALNAFIPLGGATTLTALLQALESNGLVKTLAEPNLTAVSGETASFLVGGQFPVPSPQPSGSGGAATISVVYKDFGVRLTFTPVVLSGGLINLRIATEVSQLSTQGQINANGFTIPALTVRRAETTVELPSGGSIAIAGLLQNDIQNTIQGFPLLKDIPVLGSLFSSTQFQRNESDLVIAVTPMLVRPVDPNMLAFPTDGFGPASDFNMYLLGKLHANYVQPASDGLRGRPKGPYGYILE